MHYETDQKLYISEISKLFKAFEQTGPPTKKQKALTPRFLRFLGARGRKRIINSAVDHAIDLIIGGFFFACRICEVAKTPKPGLTKRLRLRNIVFCNANLTVIAHNEDILSAEFVTLVFEDQKNGERFERRTQ